MYFTRPILDRDAVIVCILNENRPSAWDSVSKHIDKNGSISNADLRKILGKDDILNASKQLGSWVRKGLLIVVDPKAAKKNRRYTKPDSTLVAPLFSRLDGK